jgi:predicted dehydrogenase
MNRRSFISKAAYAGTVLGVAAPSFVAGQRSQMKIGIIGLDTSHAPAFAKYFNETDNSGSFRVVAAYPQGSKLIQSSIERIPRFTEEVKGYGVAIVDSLGKLLKQVDVVLLTTNDGTVRKAQAFEVINAGKAMFIDKPVAASFVDVLAIYAYAREKKIPVFSASSLRYMKTVQQVRNENKIGKVIGADAFSPATLEPHHPDFFWYGIHGVEILFSIMGPGCDSVTRFSRDDMDVVVGSWKDGRIGTFRGTRAGKHDYGGTAFGETGNLALGPFDGYDDLAREIGAFFTTKKSPVDDHETIEIYAFMEAADESKRRGGASVKLIELMK